MDSINTGLRFAHYSTSIASLVTPRPHPIVEMAPVRSATTTASPTLPPSVSDSIDNQADDEGDEDSDSDWDSDSDDDDAFTTASETSETSEDEDDEFLAFVRRSRG